MRFRVLGPLAVEVDGVSRAVAGGRDRTVLAMLLLQANHVVQVEQLVDAVWAQSPPATGRAQIHNCVSRLRRVMNSAGPRDATLRTYPAGYMAAVCADDVDLLVFQQRVRRARTAAAAGQLDEASGLFRSALALWRGPALAGIGSDLVRAAAVACEEQRWSARDDSIDIELRLGRGGELVSELTGLVSRYPLREGLRAQLMLALYRADRQADALAVYLQGRQTLVQELGVEPCPESAQLHWRILTRDPALDRPEPAPLAVPRARVAAARCLPHDIEDFTGRDAAVAAVLGALAGDNRAASVIYAIDGMAGVGKTAFAVHLAHSVADRYPGGQLFLDLHGHSERAPVDPATALDLLLRQLGVAGDRIPESLDGRIAAWRTALAGRSVLLLLDNAATSHQVLPLLPGGHGCVTLITSRQRLGGLAGVRPVSLDVLSAAEAITLLRRVVGDRIDANAAASALVAAECGYLALALRLAAARLAHRPGWTTLDLLTRLRAAGSPVSELAAEGSSVTSAFSLSYSHVGVPQRRVFRLLGLHPGPDFDARAVAALADADLPAAVRLLDDLVDAQLVQEPAIGRYRLHDLLRDYARQLADAEEPQAARLAAVSRLLDCYLHSCVAVAATLETHPFDYGLRAAPRYALTTFEGTAGSGWMAAERANVIASAPLAEQAGLPRHCWQLARACWRYLYINGHYDDLLEMNRLALHCARELDDHQAIAETLSFTASAYFRLGRYQQAVDSLQQAAKHASHTTDAELIRRVDYRIGAVLVHLCRYEQALSLMRKCLAGGRADDLFQAAVLSMVGIIQLMLGRYPAARQANSRSLALARRAGNRWAEGVAVGHLGAVELGAGRLDAAERKLRQAIGIKREVGNTVGEAEVVNDLAIVYRRRGQHDQAIELHRQAMELILKFGNRYEECAIHNALGATLRSAGDVEGAREQHQLALELAIHMQTPLEHGRALAGLMRTELARNPAAARDCRRQALAIFTELRVPDLDETANGPVAVSGG